MFYTFPVTDFRTLPDGEDVNIIDAATIRSIVHSLLASDSPSTPVSTDNVRASAHPWANAEPTAHRVALDVINASGQDGVAVAVRNALAKGQFTEGTVSTADSISAASAITYGTGAQSAAELRLLAAVRRSIPRAGRRAVEPTNCSTNVMRVNCFRAAGGIRTLISYLGQCAEMP